MENKTQKIVDVVAELDVTKQTCFIEEAKTVKIRKMVRVLKPTKPYGLLSVGKTQEELERDGEL